MTPQDTNNRPQSDAVRDNSNGDDTRLCGGNPPGPNNAKRCDPPLTGNARTAEDGNARTAENGAGTTDNQNNATAQTAGRYVQPATSPTSEEDVPAAHAAAILQAYHDAFVATWDDDTAAKDVRFAVLDCETTGTDARKDALVSIGAVSVQEGQILLGDAFDALLKLRYNSASVVVHGITREEAELHGLEERTALLQLLDYLKGAVIVGHHIGFDIDVLNRALQRNFGIELRNRWLDTMELVLHLEQDGVLPQAAQRHNPDLPQQTRHDFSLDGLCRQFGIAPHDRHTAAGDAFITAQLFIKLLKLASHSGRTTLGLLAERWQTDGDGTNT